MKVGDCYRRIHAIIGDVIFADPGSTNLSNAAISHGVYAFYPTDYATWKIVERDGKPYTEPEWKPKNGEGYFISWEVKITLI